MGKWITFDISDGTSNKDASRGLLLCSYGALLCVQCVSGLQGHEYLQGGGGLMRMVAWVGGTKSPYTPSMRPYTSQYTAVYSEVYGKNTSPILRVYCPIPQKV